MKYILILLAIVTLSACNESNQYTPPSTVPINESVVTWDGDAWMAQQKIYNETISQCAWVISESYVRFLDECADIMLETTHNIVANIETFKRIANYYDNDELLFKNHFSNPNEIIRFLEVLDITANEILFIMQQMDELKININDPI